MRIRYEGELGPGVTAKDLILGTIGQMGTNGAAGHVVEYAGAGDRAALDGGPHDRLQHDHRGRRPGRHGGAGRHDVRLARGPRRRAGGDLDAAVEEWRGLHTDEGAGFDREIVVDAAALVAARDLGHDAGAGRRRDATRCPSRARRRERARAALHGARARHADARSCALDRVFIGSCTNSRIGDLRAAAARGRGAHGLAGRRARWSCPAREQVQRAGRGRGPRPRVPRRRLRLARRRAARCASA